MKKNYDHAVERGKAYGYDMEVFIQDIKDQKEDIDKALRDQIKKQMTLLKEQNLKKKQEEKRKRLQDMARQSKRMLRQQMSKRKNMAHSNSIGSGSSDLFDDSALQNIGIHHVGGRVVHIDMEMIKEDKKKAKKKKKKPLYHHSTSKPS